jgi:hypothetical protein
VTALRDALARKDISKTDKYLLIVGYHHGHVMTAAIRQIAKDNGWKDGATSRPELFLSKSAHAILLPKGWTLTGPGRSSLDDRKLISKIGVLTPAEPGGLGDKLVSADGRAMLPRRNGERRDAPSARDGVIRSRVVRVS